QGDGYAQAPVDDLVEVAVARVVVADRIAAKCLLAKQQRVHGGNLSLGHRLVGESSPQRLTELVDLVQVGLWLESWVFFAGDEQRSARQVELALVGSGESSESPPRICSVRGGLLGLRRGRCGAGRRRGGAARR